MQTLLSENIFRFSQPPDKVVLSFRIQATSDSFVLLTELRSSLRHSMSSCTVQSFQLSQAAHIGE